VNERQTGRMGHLGRSLPYGGHCMPPPARSVAVLHCCTASSNDRLLRRHGLAVRQRPSPRPRCRWSPSQRVRCQARWCRPWVSGDSWWLPIELLGGLGSHA
jgi:hypothetical protein